MTTIATAERVKSSPTIQRMAPPACVSEVVWNNGAIEVLLSVNARPRMALVGTPTSR
jgi:hypothetical protein